MLVVVLLLQACATVGQRDARDPLESVNRSIFSFNDVVDRAVLKPVATVYRVAFPSWARTGVSNFFGNLQDVWSVVNNAVQLRGNDTGDSLARVMVNSTLGIAGLLDLATDLNIERHSSNFGLTLGRWGVPPGPYLVVPLLGPYTLREVAAIPVDRRGDLVNQLDDVATRDTLTVVDLVSIRAKYLQSGDVVDGAALDKYSFTRDVYLQRQRNQDYDGNPPDADPTPSE